MSSRKYTPEEVAEAKEELSSGIIQEVQEMIKDIGLLAHLTQESVLQQAIQVDDPTQVDWQALEKIIGPWCAPAPKNYGWKAFGQWIIGHKFLYTKRIKEWTDKLLAIPNEELANNPPPDWIPEVEEAFEGLTVLRFLHLLHTCHLNLERGEGPPTMELAHIDLYLGHARHSLPDEHPLRQPALSWLDSLESGKKVMVESLSPSELLEYLLYMRLESLALLQRARIIYSHNQP